MTTGPPLNQTINKTTIDDITVWSMVSSATIISSVYIVINIVVGVFCNCLLIVIINHSPTLRTPANSHLINICANNLVLCLSMLLSLVTLLLPSDVKRKANILTGFHIFLTSNCFLQYWGTFSSISYYRATIVRRTSMSIRKRRQVITRCIATSWATSLLVSLLMCLSNIEHDVYACMTLNPFQKEFVICDDDDVKYSTQKLAIVAINVLTFLIMLLLIVVSYCTVFKALNKGKGLLCGKNRVTPTTRALSLISDISSTVHDQAFQRNAAQFVGHTDKTVYSIFKKDVKLDNEYVVHYQRNDSVSMLTFEDIIALENPILATHMRRQILQRRPLNMTQSTASNNSVKSKGDDFTDISAGADLQRYQAMKNDSALRNHFIRRDRVGFNSATKNSLVMLASFIACSLPMYVCIMPYVLSANQQSHRVLILLFTKLVFYLNAPIYPLWYLIQDRRVRKCLIRVYESICLKLDMRR
ncbi:hypothetical protein ACF0H5_017801 [Mactra antiquata]